MPQRRNLSTVGAERSTVPGRLPSQAMTATAKHVSNESFLKNMQPNKQAAKRFASSVASARNFSRQGFADHAFVQDLVSSAVAQTSMKQQQSVPHVLEIGKNSVLCKSAWPCGVPVAALSKNVLLEGAGVALRSLRILTATIAAKIGHLYVRIALALELIVT